MAPAVESLFGVVTHFSLVKIAKRFRGAGWCLSGGCSAFLILARYDGLVQAQLSTSDELTPCSKIIVMECVRMASIKQDRFGLRLPKVFCLE